MPNSIKKNAEWSKRTPAYVVQSVSSYLPRDKGKNHYNNYYLLKYNTSGLKDIAQFLHGLDNVIAWEPNV